MINYHSGPVIIGGIGGSGTRVIAEIFVRCGFYIGSDLNESLDNLCYTLLFKRKRWFQRNRKNKAAIEKLLHTFSALHLGQKRLTFAQWGAVVNALIEVSWYGHNHLRSGRGLWAIKHFINILNSKKIDLEKYTGWGWKEPNTHIILDELQQFYPTLKYVLVVRNGLDMAFSTNQQQLFNWGRIYNINTDKSYSNNPSSSFAYWKAATSQAIVTGHRMGADRFHIINFEKLSENPKEVISNLLQFCAIPPDKYNIEELIKIPKRPDSVGRYRHFDQSWLTTEDKEFLYTLGYESCGCNLIPQ